MALSYGNPSDKIMQIKPIFSALKKHKLATVLIALEIALACAVLCNAALVIATRLSAMNIVSGVDEASLGIVVVTGFAPEQTSDLNARMLSGLATVAGVDSVHVVSSVPFGPQRGVFGITLDHETNPAVVGFYEGDRGSPHALGLKLVAGLMPTAEDYQAQPEHGYFPASSRVLITRELATKLWPGSRAVGKEFWSGENHFRVIGIMAKLAMAHPASWGKRAPGWSVFVPALAGGRLSGTYLIRAKPQVLNRVMLAAQAKVSKIAPEVVIDHASSHTISSLRAQYFKADRAMAGLLISVIAAILGVTALGIVGLASFWVAQRRKQIGVRRALGATRADILHYFQTENFIIVSIGALLGMLLAFGINLLLMQWFELPRLPLWTLPVG
ncbi:MAG: FtsX-like permease family protein, partial [Xanthomonadales bacterium]|nr:FtsX-like permease family protein [Xanthomonadales bacterium]